MEQRLSHIWIESEEKGAILGGAASTQDNTDVVVTLEDGSRYVATFFTYQNIEYLRQKNRETGECLGGAYFWAADMILVDTLERADIEALIDHLINAGEFEQVFRVLTAR